MLTLITMMALLAMSIASCIQACFSILGSCSPSGLFCSFTSSHCLNI